MKVHCRSLPTQRFLYHPYGFVCLAGIAERQREKGIAISAAGIKSNGLLQLGDSVFMLLLKQIDSAACFLRVPSRDD